MAANSNNGSGGKGANGHAKGNGEAGKLPASFIGSASIAPEYDGGSSAASFRYSRQTFQRTLLIAAGLTFLICLLVWLLLGIYGSRHMNRITGITGLVFFAFVSAKAVLQYAKNEVVLAIQPTGLIDKRISPEVMSWDTIREVRLARREREHHLQIVLWSRPGEETVRHDIDISPLDGHPAQVLDALSRHVRVVVEG